jgi:hypothetical protein
MTETIYIELKTATIVESTDPSEPESKYRVYLSPVDTIDDTYKNELDTVPEEEEVIPNTLVTNTKRITHLFTLNGMLQVNDEDATEDIPVTKLLPDQSSAQGLQDPTSKLGRLRILFGYGVDYGEDLTLTFFINDITYECFMSRLTTIPTAGQVDHMDFIIELTEGEAY